jgi:hypothetical protein
MAGATSHDMLKIRAGFGRGERSAYLHKRETPPANGMTSPDCAIGRFQPSLAYSRRQGQSGLEVTSMDTRSD